MAIQLTLGHAMIVCGFELDVEDEEDGNVVLVNRVRLGTCAASIIVDESCGLNFFWGYDDDSPQILGALIHSVTQTDSTRSFDDLEVPDRVQELANEWGIEPKFYLIICNES
jgi:hypothetical protein